MKRHLGWLHVAASAAIVAGSSLPQVVAQYAPYRPIPQQPAPNPVAAQPPVTHGGQPAYMAYRPQPAPYRAPGMAAYGQPGGYPQAAAAYPQTAAQYSPYQGYPMVAQQPTEAMPAPTQGEVLPTPPQQMEGAPTNGTVVPSGAVMPNGYSTPVPDHGYGGAYGGGHSGGYPSTGCSGDAAGYGYGNNCNSYPDYGMSGYFDNECHDSQWFGGVYFLWMERDNAAPVKLTVEVDHDTSPDPYYPQPPTTVVSTHQTDFDYREGVEVRIGSTFSIGSACDSGHGACGNGYGYGYGCEPCAPCSVDVYAWEFVWWGLDDDAQDYTFVDEITTDRRHVYGMKDFHGLEYSRDGNPYRWVNNYYNYGGDGTTDDAEDNGLPIEDPDAYDPTPREDGYVSILAQRVRTNFRASNLELNIIRFPMCNVSCGGGGCGHGGYGGCDAGGCGDYGYGYGGECGCEEPCVSSAFSMYGACGVRYFRTDDDFLYCTEFSEWAGGVPDQAAYDGFSYDSSNELFYDIDVENHLIGPQVGWTMNYCVACKWNFFCNSTFGIFNNHINHYQRLYTGGDGDVRFIHSGESFSVRSEKDDIAFLGELRLGGSYDVTCHWRAIAAYRAVAIAGLATSTDQIPDDFTSPEYVAIIDSDNSMIVHGFQVGAECRY
jgi:hypothetical protein